MLAVAFLVTLCCLLALPILISKEKYVLDDVHRAEAPGRFVELKLGKVHYQLEGDPDAPLVVLVHGFSAPSYMWDNNRTVIASAGYRVLTFDLFGRGYSCRPKVNYDKALFVEQVRELTELLVPNKPFHIIGLSMGGAITSAFVKQYPKRILSVGYLAPFNQAIDIGALTLPIIGKWLGYTLFIPKLPANQTNDLVAPDKFPFWSDKFSEQMKYKGFSRAVISTGRHLIAKDPSEDFLDVGTLSVPKLVLWGTEDKVIPLSDLECVVQLLGDNTSYSVFENAGHALQYECYERVNKRIIEHLNHV
ncbi:alpha/beta fold hydrolase [Vibrio maritimus]|uniref:alpha/beta fold hydrolase n=1 Tax=Vibrio maritimus TaxID=990268 RepID=UPI00373674F5